MAPKNAFRDGPAKGGDRKASASGEITREKILQAALQEFGEKGFEAASVRNIGKRGDVAFPLVTYYFETKENLWREAAQRSFSAAWERISAARRDCPSGDPVQRIYAFATAFARFCWEHEEFHRFMLQESHTPSARLKWLVDNFIKSSADELVKDVKAAQESGMVQEGDPYLIHYLLVSIISSVPSMRYEVEFVTGSSLDCEVAIRTTLGFVRRALGLETLDVRPAAGKGGSQ